MFFILLVSRNSEICLIIRLDKCINLPFQLRMVEEYESKSTSCWTVGTLRARMFLVDNRSWLQSNSETVWHAHCEHDDRSRRTLRYHNLLESIRCPRRTQVLRKSNTEKMLHCELFLGLRSNFSVSYLITSQLSHSRINFPAELRPTPMFCQSNQKREK